MPNCKFRNLVFLLNSDFKLTLNLDFKVPLSFDFTRPLNSEFKYHLNVDVHFRLNFDVDNNMFLETIFHKMFAVSAFENGTKIELVSYLFRKHRFCKNHCFSMKNCYFSNSEPEKTDPKSMQKHTRK